MTLHIYRCENPKRTRRLCPHHKKLEYGELQDFYDTRRIFFDCGTFVDYGYGYYEPPKKYKQLETFWDSERQSYTLIARRPTWHILFSSPNHTKIIRIANDRLKPQGTIKDASISSRERR